MISSNELLPYGFYNMDCMEGMKRFPDKYFDLAIVDPPYRNSKENQPTKDMRKNGTLQCFGDKPGKEYFNELFRVSKNQIIWGMNNFELPTCKGFIVWEKTNIPINFTMSMAEIAYMSEGISTISKIYSHTAQRDSKDVRISPCQKPIELYRWIIERYSKPNDIIIDTHVGSASSLIARHETGHKYVGFEIDKTYYDMAKKRLDDAEAQMTIFDYEKNQ